MTTADLSTFIKEQALRLGFDACGIAKADRISDEAAVGFHTWLQGKHQAGMDYMERNLEKRMDPRLLVEGCRSVIVVALNYEPVERRKPEKPQIAKFAYGLDYHDLIRSKLRRLLQIMNEQGPATHGRAFTDSAPVAERYWAAQAGLGWLGRNHQLILPGKGSTFLLGVLLVNIDLEYDTPVANRCGNCRRCLDACPSRALDGASGLDANRCLSYLTIEKRGSFNALETSLVEKNNCLFGCDLCLDACPWNRFSTGNETPELQPGAGFLNLGKEDFKRMTESEFSERFAGTCLERAGYEGLRRNLETLG
jgi:epoxyqueuosine reductase